MKNQEYKRSFHLNLQETIGLSVYNTGQQQCPPLHTIGPGVRPYYLLHYIVSGRGRFSMDGKDYDLYAGEAFLIYPSVICQYTAHGQDPWQYCWVAFNGADVHRLVALSPFSRENPTACFEEGEEVERRIQGIVEAVGVSTVNEVEMVGRLYTLFAHLIQVSGKAEQENSSSRGHLKSALRFIHNNYSRSLSVDNIADYIGISSSHLYRVFMQEQNISPSRYLTEYRIRQACTLLQTGMYTVGEVANSVGFEDALYFSRVFRKIKGMSPTAYVRRKKEKQDEGRGKE